MQRERIPSSLKPTRIEKGASSEADHSDEMVADTIDPEDSSSGYSNDEEEHELNKARIKPYNMLLQQLAANSQPPQKKRKINEPKEREDAENLENDEDLVEELEELESFEADDLIGSGDEVEPQGGDCGPFNINDFTKDNRLLSI